MKGFRLSKGEMILALSSYIQTEPKDLEKGILATEEGNDLFVTRRYPQKDPIVNRIQSYLYHLMVRTDARLLKISHLVYG
jgi:hypothetical protein